MAAKIIALHGFLGLPRDFRPLKLDNIYALNIFSTTPGAFYDWAERTNRLLPDASILMGYSMGGRLALHCLLKNPQQFQAAIILAAHPGLEGVYARLARINADYAWANKIVLNPWSSLIKEWNNTPILQSSRPVKRNEREFSRVCLALFLRYFSLGKQEFLLPQINELPMPILWITPFLERQHCQGISFKHPQSQKLVIQGSHRFMFEDPNTTKTIINKFLAQIK